MKKRFAAIALTAALALCAVPALAFASNVATPQFSAYAGGGGQCASGCARAAGNAACVGLAFVDGNGDGVCDKRGEHVSFIDNDGDGLCDNCAQLAGAAGGLGDGSCPAPRDGTGFGAASDHRGGHHGQGQGDAGGRGMRGMGAAANDSASAGVGAGAQGGGACGKACALSGR